MCINTKIEVIKKMPRGDRTGPWGAGSMTGRATGYCAGYTVPGFMNSVRGYGRGFGRCFGRGRYAYSQSVSVQPAYSTADLPSTRQVFRKEEAVTLENYQSELLSEKADLEKEINSIRAKIETLKVKL